MHDVHRPLALRRHREPAAPAAGDHLDGAGRRHLGQPQVDDRSDALVEDRVTVGQRDARRGIAVDPDPHGLEQTGPTGPEQRQGGRGHAVRHRLGARRPQGRAHVLVAGGAEAGS